MAGLIKGVMERVPNLDQRFGSNPEYIAIKVDSKGLGHQEEVLLLTDTELEVARKRAGRCIGTLTSCKTNWIRDLID